MTMSLNINTRVSPVVRLEVVGPVAVIVIDNPPVNASSHAVREGLLEAVRSISDADYIEAAVLIGAGNTFVAGSDIREFGKPLEDPQLPAVIAAIEGSSKVFVAAIHGASLGGGYELALGCDARVASTGAVVGLPEVILGMIPGAGGTQRLPRLVGIPAAIEIICSGRRIGAPEALTLGMIDKVIDGDLRTGAMMFARELNGRKRQLSQSTVPAATSDRVEKASTDALKAGRGRPHVALAIEAVKSTSTLSFADALAHERAVFERLRSGTEAAALRHLFFAERDASKIEGIEKAATRNIRRVGIVGAGTMGVGIATCFIDAGYEVTLVEQDETGAARGLERMREIQERAVASGRLAAGEMQQRLARVRPTGSLRHLADADLVVEAVFEDMEVKVDLFRRLESVVRNDTILASNTSYLDLDRIAESTQRPANVIGLHFFSPAHVMKLLEIVRGARTSLETLASAIVVGKKLRKTAVTARVGEGFIGNRIYAAYRRQCEFMLEEGAYPEEVDAAMTEFGFAMGPFAVSDMSGLDIAWKMRQRLAATRDPKSRYVEIADRLCEQGRFGQKANAGWYKYEAGKRGGEPDTEVRALIDAASNVKGIARRGFTREEIYRRALLTMVNEASLLLEEGIAARASDVDLVMVSGYGFPRHEGGPLFWASRQDRDRIKAEIGEIAAISGHGFRTGKLDSVLDQIDR